MMASKHGISVLSTLLRSSRASSPFVAAPLLRPYPRLPRTLQPAQIARRYAHQIPRPGRPTPPAGEEDEAKSETKPRKLLEPHYELTFTCVPCSTRSTHAISKQGYHKGSVLITCPSCRNRHIISDHLNIFGDRKLTIEDLMRERGQLVKRGTLGVDGDIEFWEDGTQTERGASSTVATDTGLTNESEAANKDEEVSALQQSRDPLSSSKSSATAAAPPLGSRGSRPRLDDASTTNDTPSTRRQFHTASPHQVQLDSFRFSGSELAELRAKLRRQDAKPERTRKPYMITDEDLAGLEDGDQPSLDKRRYFRKTQSPMTSTKNSVRQFYPPKALQDSRRNPSDTDSPDWGSQDPIPDAISQPIRESHFPFRKVPIGSTMGRPNLRNHEARKLMGFGEEDYRNGKVVDQKGTGEVRDHNWPEEGFEPRRSRDDVLPGPSRVRFTNQGMKFQTQHYEASSGSKTWAPEKEGRMTDKSPVPGLDSTEPWNMSLAARMRRVQKDKSHKRTLYAWPEGATEAVEVQVDIQGKMTPQPQKPIKRLSRHSGKQPKFRKLTPKEARDKNAPISPDAFMTEMFGGKPPAPQRPLPEETYERITKGVESARNLPQQKVQLEDF